MDSHYEPFSETSKELLNEPIDCHNSADCLESIMAKTLAALEDDYRANKHQTLSMLQSALSDDAESDWSDVARRLHMLAGTAGHFGDARLGELVALLEHRLRSASDDAEKRRAARATWTAMVKAI